jgi:hypothetical protein
MILPNERKIIFNKDKIVSEKLFTILDINESDKSVVLDLFKDLFKLWHIDFTIENIPKRKDFVESFFKHFITDKAKENLSKHLIETATIASIATNKEHFKQLFVKKYGDIDIDINNIALNNKDKPDILFSDAITQIIRAGKPPTKK